MFRRSLLINHMFTSYNDFMIISFAHKGLENFYKTGEAAGIQHHHAAKLHLILEALDASSSPANIQIASVKRQLRRLLVNNS